MARQPEPWPGPPSWKDSFGGDSFEVIERGKLFDLLEAEGQPLYVGSYPSLYLVEQSAGNARLVSMPLPALGDGWRVEAVWTNETCSPCVTVDRLRHHRSSTAGAHHYARRDGAWKELSEPHRPAQPGVEGHLAWSRGRTLLVGDEGHVRWEGEATGPTPTVRDYSAECVSLWEYVDDFWPATAVHGDNVYVSVATCGPNEASVIRFNESGVGTFLPPLPHPETLRASLHVMQNGHLVHVASCNRTHGAYGGTCVSVFDGSSWSDEGQAMDGLALASHAFASDDALWIVLAQPGDGRTGASDARAPTPAGEVHRRSPEGRWETFAFPRHDLAGWKLVRFVPLDLALVDDVPWVSGVWYYVRKPDPDTVETLVHGGLLRKRALAEP